MQPPTRLPQRQEDTGRHHHVGTIANSLHCSRDAASALRLPPTLDRSAGDLDVLENLEQSGAGAWNR